MKEFTWKIVEVNAQAGTMVVEYTYNDMSSAYNIPMPGFGEDLGEWVKVYAPVADWDRMDQIFADVQAGMHGTGTIEQAPDVVATEQPNVVGSWQEEYLRALIYQILEEIRESQV